MGRGSRLRDDYSFTTGSRGNTRQDPCLSQSRLSLLRTNEGRMAERVLTAFEVDTDMKLGVILNWVTLFLTGTLRCRIQARVGSLS